jgi:pyruvate,water dikinase
MMPTTNRPLILPLRTVDMSSVAEVGGKNASLGELLQHLVPLGVRVPDGFAITATAFRMVLAQHGAADEIHRSLDALDVRDVARLAELGAAVRRRVQELPLPPELERGICAAYAELSRACGEAETDVAVRSSATAEDLPAASFAGQQESFLNVRGAAALLTAVRACMASLFTDRAIVYRTEHGFPHRAVALSVGVQKMVRSDLACAGVAFSIDTESGSPDVVMITGSWGLGESVVKGRVDPDEFWVHKPTLAAGHRPILRRERGSKEVKLVYGQGGTAAVGEVRVPAAERTALVLDDDEVLQLANWTVRIEQHYSAAAGTPTPMDVEWAKDGRTGELFVVQARPETVHSQRRGRPFEVFRLQGKGDVLVRGKSVGSAIGAGPVRIVRSPGELAAVRPGDVLVAAMTDPDWEPVLARAAAVVTDHGGRTCHAAIVSRELGLPCVVGTGDATRTLADGQQVTVSCAEHEGRVFAGALPFVREQVDPARLPVPRVPVMLNVGDPDAAFRLAQLPCAGVGLARLEFVISSAIGAHPMALLFPDRVADAAERARLAERTACHASGADFFVERLASGVARIAAAFHPRPVIVRFSDFKTNEYARLLGGAAFEPDEANPMIGFRGASRYYHERYRQAFALECRALRSVRDDMGLTNVKLMIPFCRTLEEGRRVLAELAANGLRRGERELEVWVMCEIPNNVVLAAEFCALFDGFSIGSNDLTQLTLGIDRDSELLAPLFDEADPGVKQLIRTVTEVAHAHGRRVGLCGQAPSDDPEYAAFLAELGLDSISVTADAFATVVTRLARAPGPRAAGATGDAAAVR